MDGNQHDQQDTSHLAGSGSDAYRIQHLIDRLGWTGPVGLILSALLVAACFYLLQAKPLAESVAKAQQQDATERVVARVESMVGQIERVLLTLQEWSRDGLADINIPADFNRLLIPVLQQRSIVSSIHLASDEGQEILLLKSPDGWKNRLTNVPKHGTKQHWLTWKDAASRTSEEWKEQDYDPRKRPWFSGAMATPENQIHWTAPYVFQATKDPGITASIRWRDNRTGKQMVVAFDVLLTDISRFTTQLAYGKNGQVALVTEPAAAAKPAAPAGQGIGSITPLPGIDIKAGMATCTNKESLYLRMLGKFRDSQGNFAELFAAAKQDADPEATTRAAHTLKGTAGNIGARGVKAAAAELEHACKERAPAGEIETLLQKTLAELAPVIGGLQQVGSGGMAAAPAKAAAIPEAQLKEALAKLKHLLEESDSEAGDLLNDLLDKLGSDPLARKLKPVAAAIEGFDFDAALMKLGQI